MPDSDSLMVRLGKYVFANFDYVGFAVLIGWNFAGGLYTLPASILVFAWAIPLSGKTPTKFWALLLIYTTAILATKMCLQKSIGPLLDFVMGTARNDFAYEYLLLVVLVAEIIVGELFGNSS